MQTRRPAKPRARLRGRRLRRLDIRRLLSRRLGARARSGRDVLHAVSRRLLLRDARLLAFVLVAFALRKRRARLRLGERLPRPYRLALLGIPIFVAGGHRRHDLAPLLGIEEGVDALFSPTHQVLGLGIFFLRAGRSARCSPIAARDDARRASCRSRSA